MLGSLRSGAEERFWKKIPEHARGKNGVFSQTLRSACEKTPFFQECSGEFFQNLSLEPHDVIEHVSSRPPFAPSPALEPPP
jgi:hypothetical protein